MWHTLATLELALGCLYPVILAVQHNFPPDVEVRKSAYFELQFHFRSLGFCIHPLRIHNEVEPFTGQSVVIYLHNKQAYLALAEQNLMIYLKQNLAAETEACWNLRIDTRYLLPAEDGMIAVLPSVWWQTVISAMESTAPLNSIA